MDDSGDIVEQNIKNQADMCEIIRAAIFAGHFAMITKSLQNIPLEILNQISCPGDPNLSQICAATSS